MYDNCIEPKGEEDREAQDCIGKLLRARKSYEAAYLEVCVLKGYSTSKAGKMSARFDVQWQKRQTCLVTQQRDNRYPSLYVGASVRE
jgi:hypothetical protein